MSPSVREDLHDALAHWPAVFGLAKTLVRDRDRAEDLCQEAYLRLAAAAEPVRDPGHARARLLTIVRNLAIDAARRPAPVSLDAAAENGGLPADPRAADPRRRAEAGETGRRVRAALDRLDPVWRLVLYLRDGLGLKYAEIAAVAGKSEDVVRVTLHRARLRVRDALRDLVEEGSRP